jgi:transcriptional regulator
VVPTWNCVAVHAYGPAEFFEDADRLLDVITLLTNLQRAERAETWAAANAPEAFVSAQLRGIVGPRLPIVRIDGKHKMSQNRSAADRAGVACGLAASESASDRAVAPPIPH